MTSSGTNNVKVGYSWILILLLAFAMLLLAAVPAWADDCGTAVPVMDGYTNYAGVPPPAQIQIVGNCTIKNFPASNPLTSNISFYTKPGQNNERWLVIFDNVVFTGQMACDAVQGHTIWFTNGSTYGIKPSCQNLLIPVE